MSLINDALKKAQNRHGETSAPVPPGAAAIPPAPGTGRSSAGKAIALGAGLVVLCVVASVTVTVLLLRQTPEKTPVPTIMPVPASPASTTAQTQPASPVQVVPPAAPTAAINPQTPAAGISSQPMPAAVTPPVVVAAPPAPLPEPVIITPVVPSIKLGTRIQAFVDRLRITSIRISDTGNKAILNDRLFRVGDLVEPGLGLRLTDIQPSVLTFTDEDGNSYLRRF